MTNEDAIRWLENLKQDTGSQAGMSVTERAINDLNTVKLILCNPQMLTPEMCIRIGQVVTSAIILLKEQEIRELTIDEWKEWKKNPKRNPICELWEHDTSPMWVLNPDTIHEPALLMGKLKLFTGKPTLEQCKAVKWDD